MNEKYKITLVNLPIAGLLGIAFIILKLCKVIDWSWWWVTVPFWAIPALLVAVFLIVVIWFIIYSFISEKYYASIEHKQSERGSFSPKMIKPDYEKKDTK